MHYAKTRVVVIGTGARTVVGMTAPSTAAAVRAGIVRFGQHPFMVDAAGERMIVARASYLDSDSFGTERLAELACPAAMEAVAQLVSARVPSQALSIFIGLPPVRPGRSNDLWAIAEKIGGSLSAAGLCVGKVTMIEKGHASGAMAIQAAWELLQSGKEEFALVGGVDSYLAPETLEWLEANEQVHSAGPANNAYGFVPGEGSGFVLLATATAAARYDLSASSELLTAATRQETKLIKTDSVCLGEGLTALFRALSGVPATIRIDHLYCDMNGEPYRADEFGFATMSAGKLFRGPSSFTTPADCWGDVGAASGPLFLVLGNASFQRHYAKGSVLAAFTSSESGERSGFVLGHLDV